MKYIALIILLCLLNVRLRLTLGYLIFGVTGAQGDSVRCGPVAAWQFAGAAVAAKDKK
jgi:hypothetical protein